MSFSSMESYTVDAKSYFGDKINDVIMGQVGDIRFFVPPSYPPEGTNKFELDFDGVSIPAFCRSSDLLDLIENVNEERYSIVYHRLYSFIISCYTSCRFEVPWDVRQVDIVIQPNSGMEFGVEVQMSSVPIKPEVVKSKMNHYDKTITCFWKLDRSYLIKFFEEYLKWPSVAQVLRNRGLKHISEKTKLKHYSIEKSKDMNEVEKIMESHVNLDQKFYDFHFKDDANMTDFNNFMKNGQTKVLDDIMDCILNTKYLEKYCENNYADSPETLDIYMNSVGEKREVRQFNPSEVNEILSDHSNLKMITDEERDYLELVTKNNKKLSIFPIMDRNELDIQELYDAANNIMEKKYNAQELINEEDKPTLGDFQGDKINSFKGIIATVIKSDEDLKEIKATIENRIRDFTIGDRTMSNLIKTSSYKSDPTFLENMKKILRINEKVQIEDLQKDAQKLGYKINGRGMVRLNMTDSLMKTVGIKTRLVERRSSIEQEISSGQTLVIRSIIELLSSGLFNSITLDNYYISLDTNLLMDLAVKEDLPKFFMIKKKLARGELIEIKLKSFSVAKSSLVSKIIVPREIKNLFGQWIEKELEKQRVKNSLISKVSEVYTQRSSAFNNYKVYQTKVIYEKELKFIDKTILKNNSNVSFGRCYNFHEYFDEGMRKISKSLNGVSNTRMVEMCNNLDFKEMKWVDRNLAEVTANHICIKEFARLEEHSLLMAETALNQVIAKNSRATREKAIKPTVDGFKFNRILSNCFIVYSDAPTDDSTGIVFIIFKRTEGQKVEWWEPKIHKLHGNIYYTSPVRFNMGYVKSTMDHTVGTLSTRLMEYILTEKDLKYCTSMSPWMLRLSSHYSRNLRAITDWTKQMYAQFQAIASFGRIDIKDKFVNIIETDVYGYACSRIESNFKENYQRYLSNIVDRQGGSISGIVDLITDIPYKHHQSLQMMSALNNFLIRDDRAHENSKKTEFTYNEAKYQEEYDMATTSGIKDFSYINQNAIDFFKEVFPEGKTTPYSVYHNAILYSTTLLKEVNKGKDMVTINEMDNVSRGKPSSLNKVLTGKEEMLNRKQKIQTMLLEMIQTKFQNVAEISSKIYAHNKSKKENFEEQREKLHALKSITSRAQTIIIAIHGLSSSKIRRVRKSEILTEEQIEKNRKTDENIRELINEGTSKLLELLRFSKDFHKPIFNLSQQISTIFIRYVDVDQADGSEILEDVEEEFAIKGKTGVYASKNSQLIYELELDTKKDIIEFLQELNLDSKKLRELIVAVNNSDLTNKIVSLMALIKGYKKADVTLEIKRTEANFDKRGFFMQSIYTHVINQLADTSLIPLLPKLYSNIQESGNRKNLIFDDIVSKAPYFLAMAFDMTKFGDKMVLEGLATFIKGAVYNKMIDQELGNWLTVCVESLYGRVLIVPDSVQRVMSEYKAYKKLLTSKEKTKAEEIKLMKYNQKFNRQVYKGEEATKGSIKLSSMCEMIISECDNFKASEEYKDYPKSITANYCIRITRGFILGVLNMFGTVMSAMSRIIEERMYLWLGLPLSFYKGIAQSDDCLSFYFLRPDSKSMFGTVEYAEFKKKVKKNCFDEVNNKIVWRDTREEVNNDLLYTLVLEIAFLVARFFGLRFGTLKSRPGRREMLQVDYIDKSWVPALMKFTYTIFKNVDEGDFQNSLLQASTGGIQSLRTYGARGDLIENLLIFNQLMVYYYSKIQPKEKILQNTPMLGGIYFAHYPELIEHGFSAYSGYILNNVIHSKRYERQFSACILNPNIYNTIRQYTNKESEEKVNLLNFIKLDIKKPQSGIIFKLLDPLTKEFIKYSRFHIGEYSKNNLLNRFTETESIIKDYELRLVEVERLIQQEEDLNNEYLKLLKSKTASDEEISIYKEELKTARDNKVGAILGLNPLIASLDIGDILDLRKRYGIITSMIKRPKETDESRQLRVMASMKYWIIKNPFSESMINTLVSKGTFTSDIEAEYMSWKQIIEVIEAIVDDTDIKLGDYKDLFIDAYKKEILSAKAKYVKGERSTILRFEEKDFKWDVQIKTESGDMSIRALLIYYIKLELEAKAVGPFVLKNNSEYEAVTSEFDILSEESKNRIRKIHDTLSYYNIRTTVELVKNINMVENLFNRFRRSEVIRLPFKKPNKFLMYNYTSKILNLVRQSDLTTEVVSTNSRINEMFMGKYSDLTTLVSLVNSTKLAIIIKRKTGLPMSYEELRMYRVFKSLSGRKLFEKFSIESGTKRVSFDESIKSTLIAFSEDQRTAKNWFTKIYLDGELTNYQILMNVSSRKNSDSIILTDRIKELVIIKQDEFSVLVREFKSKRKVLKRGDNITASSKGAFNRNRFTVNIVMSGEVVSKIKINDEKTIVWKSSIQNKTANQNFLTHTKVNEIMYTVIHILRLLGIKEKATNMFRNRISDFNDEKIQFEKDVQEASEKVRNKIVPYLNVSLSYLMGQSLIGNPINDINLVKTSDFSSFIEKVVDMKIFKHDSSISQIVEMKVRELNVNLSNLKKSYFRTAGIKVDQEFLKLLTNIVNKIKVDLEDSCVSQITRVEANRYSVASNNGVYYLNENNSWRISVVKSFTCSPNRASEVNQNGFIFRKLIRETSLSKGNREGKLIESTKNSEKRTASYSSSGVVTEPKIINVREKIDEISKLKLPRGAKEDNDLRKLIIKSANHVLNLNRGTDESPYRLTPFYKMEGGKYILILDEWLVTEPLEDLTEDSSDDSSSSSSSDSDYDSDGGGGGGNNNNNNNNNNNYGSGGVMIGDYKEQEDSLGESSTTKNYVYSNNIVSLEEENNSFKVVKPNTRETSLVMIIPGEKESNFSGTIDIIEQYQPYIRHFYFNEQDNFVEEDTIHLTYTMAFVMDLLGLNIEDLNQKILDGNSYERWICESDHSPIHKFTNYAIKLIFDKMGITSEEIVRLSIDQFKKVILQRKERFNALFKSSNNLNLEVQRRRMAYNKAFYNKEKVEEQLYVIEEAMNELSKVDHTKEELSSLRLKEIKTKNLITAWENEMSRIQGTIEALDEKLLKTALEISQETEKYKDSLNAISSDQLMSTLGENAKQLLKLGSYLYKVEYDRREGALQSLRLLSKESILDQELMSEDMVKTVLSLLSHKELSNYIAANYYKKRELIICRHGKLNIIGKNTAEVLKFYLPSLYSINMYLMGDGFCEYLESLKIEDLQTGYGILSSSYNKNNVIHLEGMGYELFMEDDENVLEYRRFKEEESINARPLEEIDTDFMMFYSSLKDKASLISDNNESYYEDEEYESDQDEPFKGTIELTQEEMESNLAAMQGMNWGDL